MKQLPQRKKNRLYGYDYSRNGAYFVTICTKNWERLFWEPVGAISNRPPQYELTRIGKIVEIAIEQLDRCVIIDNYVIMPNHLHLIIFIDDANSNRRTDSGRTDSGRTEFAPTVSSTDSNGRTNSGRTEFAPTVSSIVRYMKSYVTKQIGFSPWQKSFHDRIIRDEQEYYKIAEYIKNNPTKWETDCFNQ